MKCKSSKPVTLKGKKQYPKNITTEPACKKLKQAARLHNDEHFLFIMSGDEDLIAKEFKMHEKCYKDIHEYAVDSLLHLQAKRATRMKTVTELEKMAVKLIIFASL